MVAPAVSFALTFLPEGVSGKRDRHSVRAEQLRHCAVGAAQHGHQGLDALATLSAALCSVEGDLSWAQVAHSLDVERRKPAASFADSPYVITRNPTRLRPGMSVFRHPTR